MSKETDHKSEDKHILDLVQGSLVGDRKSQEEIYKMFYGKMMAICLRYTKNSDQAKDYLQDGFIKVFTKLDRYNGNGSFEGWVRRIIVNNIIDSFRSNKAVFNDDVENLSEDFDVYHEEDAENFLNLKADDVVQAIQKLSPAYRTVFNLYVLENYTHKEISEKLSISVGTSKSNLAKAKQNLKTILTEEFALRHD